MAAYIEVTGAKTHNLKSIDVNIPRGAITAIVGVSGAGKTSLAFDTIYAEGYLRYIESISPYIRQFLDKIEKPPVERIEGLPPAIAFRHKKPAKNPRSIVATSLDLFDYLRILYAKAADFYCPGCGRAIKKYSIDEILAELPERFSGKIDVSFPYRGEVAFLVNRGYYFHLEEGAKKRIDHRVKDKPIDVLIDTVELKSENRGRLFEALDKSLALGNGTVHIFAGGTRHQFPAELYCPDCDVRYDAADEHLFSFNSPRGACPACKGFGDIQALDPELIFNPELSLADGAVIPFNSPATRSYGQALVRHARERGIDIHSPLKRLSKEEMTFLMEGDGAFGGVRGFFDWLKRKRYKVQARVFISRYTSYHPCQQCGGSRLNEFARSFKIRGKSLTGLLSLSIGEADAFVRQLDPETFKDRIAPEVFTDLRTRLNFLVESGLSYIHLDRATYSLSRGEYQRINLAFILGSTLSDSLLILDQPSADLHPYDYEKLKTFLQRLKANDNTLLLIEHNRDMVADCDHVLELGPLSGERGGEVVFNGPQPEFFNLEPDSGNRPAVTLTQACFRQPGLIEKSQRELGRWWRVSDAQTHNLKHIDVQIPLHAFTVIAGVSGAGKTTLLYHEMAHRGGRGTGKQDKTFKDVVFLEPGVRHLRSQTSVAGFFEIFSPVRDLFAGLKESRLQNYTPGHFSYNSPLGRCEYCKGKGYNEIEMQFLPTVEVRCSQCKGSGYNAEVLKIKYRNRHIREILDLSVQVFSEVVGNDLAEAPRQILHNIIDNGLGYVTLGQPLKTLSGGELQRIKLIKYLNRGKTGTLFLIDEPAFGLHPYDIEKVKTLIDQLVINDNTVVAAEHNMSLIAHADYIVELGPGGGEEGGHIVFQGTPAEMVTSSGSLTGIYLKKNLKNT